MSISPRSLGAVMGLTVLLFAVAVVAPVDEELRFAPPSLPADGSASARLHWSMRGLLGHSLPAWPWEVELRVLEGAERVKLIGPARRAQGAAELELAIRGRGRPGPVELELDCGPWRHRLHLELAAAEVDVDGDGFPDAAELVTQGDREAFRAWFAAIAESQFYAPSVRWAEVHRDCAGLLRFAYREALADHDAAWLAGFGYLHHRPAGEVRRFSFPRIPVLGHRPFRVRPGAFTGPGDFSSSAQARVLAEVNCDFVSRDLKRARPGDLVFFHDPEQPGSGYHSMILLDGDRLVYHTGGEVPGDGELRLVGVGDLNAHADERWHLQARNPHFLGVYRWKILEGGRP